MIYKKINVAVIKTMFKEMDKQQFIESAGSVKQFIVDLPITPENANYRYKLLIIYMWCRDYYPEKFGKESHQDFINQLKMKKWN